MKRMIVAIGIATGLFLLVLAAAAEIGAAVGFEVLKHVAKRVVLRH
jgi:hypothetical protein